MSKVDEKLIESLLTHTSSLMDFVFVIEQDFNLQPKKKHFGTAIKFNDIKARESDFIGALKKTVISWIYNSDKAKKIFADEESRTGDIGHASTHLKNLADSKFRKGHPQGQFGELLLFNFIQYFFRACPLLRKMNITTSAGHERYGSDAIHYKIEKGENIFFIGESKSYKSKYKFKEAFESALQSIINTFEKLDEELNLYVYDDFIDPKLEELAKSYKNGTLTNVNYQMVCLVAYNETNQLKGLNQQQIEKEIEEIIKSRYASLEKEFFEAIEERHLQRITYIVFPIWDAEKLLNDFNPNK